MGNVIDFGERGLALSLGNVADGRTETAPDAGLTNQEKAQWYADRLSGFVSGRMSMFAGAVHKCGRSSSRFVGIAYGIEAGTGRYCLAVLDGAEVAEVVGMETFDGMRDAYEICRCRLRNMGPRGGGKSKAYQLGKLKGRESLAREIVGKLDAVLERIEGRKIV